jgi:uncharacterized membrane protein
LFLSLAGIFVAYPFIWLVNQLGLLIALATDATPFVMGIVISVLMGIILTMPTSSAAIWLAIAGSQTAINNPEVFAIAGGAAVAGCAAHMVGFAVTSYRENGVGGLISQGLGTSMLQIPNIMRKPIIMVPEIISSAVAGLFAVILNLRCNAAGGGMGTSGLVGVFGAIEASTGVLNTPMLIFAIALCLIIIPAGVSLLVSELFRKKGLIKLGDMKLED